MKKRLLLAAFTLSSFSAFSQGTAFTYQGRLNDGAGPANGSYDLAFTLFNTNITGVAVAGPVTNSATAVSNGLFTAMIDFGPGVFTGGSNWLEIAVSTNGANSFTTLDPRQQLTPTPYAITAENLDGALLASQLTGTLPSGLLSGAYGNAVNLNNAGNNFTGNGSGLTGLNASQLAGGTMSDSLLSANVALLNRTPQTFTGANIFDRGLGGPGRLIVTGNSPLDTTAFTGLGFQYNAGPGEGAIMSSFNDGYGYLSFYTKPMFGQPITKQMIISQWGDVAVDQANANNGALNNGTVSGAGLSFGSGSGEGIASKRTATGNQFGLDLYTAFTARLSIANNGNVGIGTTTPTAKLEVAGTAGTDGIKFPDNTVQLTAPKPVFSSGFGNDPWSTNRFLSPTVVVTVTSSSQQVLVTSNKALGSVPGAQFLNLYIGYRVSGSVAAPFTVGGGSFGQKVPANTRVIMGLSGVITGLAPGNYEVGLVGSSTDYANWNSNEYGYTTATVY